MAKTYIVFIVLALLVGVAIGQHNPRFYQITEQEISGSNINAHVIHDNDTGNEVICFAEYEGHTAATMSCVATGRNWK